MLGGHVDRGARDIYRKFISQRKCKIIMLRCASNLVYYKLKDQELVDLAFLVPQSTTLIVKGKKKKSKGIEVLSTLTCFLISEKQDWGMYDNYIHKKTRAAGDRLYQCVCVCVLVGLADRLSRVASSLLFSLR